MPGYRMVMVRSLILIISQPDVISQQPLTYKSSLAPQYVHVIAIFCCVQCMAPHNVFKGKVTLVGQLSIMMQIH
jgi:hypothetical protein